MKHAIHQVSRRTLLAGSLASAVACRKKRAPQDRKLHLSFSVWGDDAELSAFTHIIRLFEQLNPGIAIDLRQISYEERHQIETLLAAGLGPDLFRVEYQEIGRYTPSGSLIDLSRYLPANLGDQFTPQSWAAVQHRGEPHALPHHTDTSAVLYNKSLFAKLGIKVPQSLAESWTWDQFIDVANHLKRACPFAFAVNWTLGGSFRWLNFLYQHGGSLTTDNGRQPAITSTAALETLRWTQSFFQQNLVPASDSARSSEGVESLFANRVVGMYFDVGPQAMRELRTGFEWSATFLPRDRHFASELGGNAVGVSRDSKHPDLAAAFALFLTNEANMRDFVTAAQFLPVRRKLLTEHLHYTYRPDEMQVHLEQSKTVPVDLARTVTLPQFYKIERVLGEELDEAFVGGQSAEMTLERIAAEMHRSLRPS